jgi:exonuclease SbcC
LQDRQQLIRQLRDLDVEYQRLLEEQLSYEVRLEELMMAQQHNNKALLNISDLRINFSEELKYKREIYQQQQLIANYEKDRQQLKSGDPCPLCLSEEHPFHAHPVTPFVDRAKDEFEKAEAYAEKLQIQERQLLQQETALHQEIESLHGDELKPVNGRLHTQREKLLHYEERIAVLLHAPDEDWSNSRGELLQNQLTQLEQRLNNWRNAQTVLESLEKQISETTEKLQALERKELTLKGEQQGVEAKLERLDKEEKELDLKYIQAKRKLDKIIQPMGYEFELATAKETFAELRKIGEEYDSKQKRMQDLQQLTALLKTEISALDKQLLKQIQSTKETSSLQIKQAEKLQQTLKQRQELLGEQTVEMAREALKKTLDEQETALQKLQEKATSVRDKLARIQQSYHDKQEERKKRIATIASLTKSLLPALKKLSYSAVSAARADQLSAGEEEQLQQKAQLIHQGQAEARRALKEATQDELKFQPEKTDQESLDKIRTDWQAAREQQDQAILQLGQLEQRYQQQQERQKQHQALIKDITAQTEVFNRWAQLNEVIGQADGKKFRTYAQGLTLQRLITLANQHLEKLNGRYFISKQTGSDLELEIIDTYQADNRRSMFTLSGGESFLISLALALGLSDLAGRHAQIQSLFIDEGFGTLDEHSLDLALDTLENLQSGGKTIGIISHVKALKERISVQVQVHKKSNGFSYLSLV